MHFSLFYFAEDAGHRTGNRYRLLLDGARYADRSGFSAVWIPERHFHPVGGIYPNPAVVGAAVAAVTERVGIRAGSVVAPLHHPLRIAEEWSVVDNLSRGRIGLSLASGWNQRDFVLNPAGFETRKEDTLSSVDVLRALWRGEGWNEDGSPQVGVFPHPVGPLRLWLSAASGVETFRAAGRAGTGVLTHLVKQDMDELAQKILEYRKAYAASGAPGQGHVTLMLHTFVDPDQRRAVDIARKPLENYLVGALTPTRRAIDDQTHAKALAAVRPAADRYLFSDGLIGGPEHGARVVDRCRQSGVDEIACLIDFGVDPDTVLAGLEHLNELRATHTDD